MKHLVLHVSACVSVCLYVCICMCVYMCVYMCVCVCVSLSHPSHPSTPFHIPRTDFAQATQIEEGGALTCSRASDIEELL